MNASELLFPLVNCELVFPNFDKPLKCEVQFANWSL